MYPNRVLLHIILTPKWRKPVFESLSLAASAEQHIRHIADFHHIQIEALAIQPDHVHLMLYLPRTLALAYAMQQIKWFSSIHLRKQYPTLKQSKALWGTHYFAKSVGGGEAAQRHYVENQMRKLQVS